MKKALIVIPTYNEKENIKNIIPAIFKIVSDIKDWDVEVLVVDDESPDGTGAVVAEMQKKYAPHLFLIKGKKSGLGNAYLRAFQYGLDQIKPYVVFEMDADFSHDPKLIPLFLNKIQQGADFVIGSRYITNGSIPKNWEFHRKVLSTLGNVVLRFGFMNLKIHDWTSGYRAIKTWFLKEILSGMKNYNGYVFQVALLNNAIKKGVQIEEIPMQFVDRTKGISKINSFQYSANNLTYILYNSSFIKFCIVGAIGFIINALALEYFFQSGLRPGIAAALGAELSIVSNFILNNFWSFSHKKIEKTGYITKFAKFNTVSFGSIIIQFLVVTVGTHYFGDPARFAFLVISVICFIIPYSYYMYNRFIWSETDRY